MGQDYSHEPSTPHTPKPEESDGADVTHDISSFPPEQQAWELLLKECLGDFYYPRYIAAKQSGQPTAWDYVRDVPGLPRVCIIGDSISRGCTLPTRHALAGQANVHRAPQNCSSTAVGERMLDKWLGDGRWDLITFNFGIHDRDVPNDDYALRLADITSRLKATGAKLVWVTTTPVPEGADEYREGSVDRLNKVAAGIMQKQAVPVLDLNAAVTPHLHEFQLANNCHFNNTGYEFMGKLLARTILNELGAPAPPQGQ